jgi:4-hydroxybenzoyl-CoA reductase subunit gamma
MTSTTATTATTAQASAASDAPTAGTPGAKKRARSILGLVLNGREREDLIPDGLLLLDYLREVVGLTGTKQGCDGGECGACTVLVDDQPRLACSTLAVQVQGRRIETVEGLTEGGTMSPLQQAFHESLGAQCGFCTPGMITTAEALLRRNPNPSVDEIKTAMGGNLCRCTGYVKIIESVQVAAATRNASARASS